MTIGDELAARRRARIEEYRHLEANCTSCSVRSGSPDRASRALFHGAHLPA